MPGYYIGPALLQYRSRHVLATATSAPRIPDTVAWFPETDVTPPLPDAQEILLAAIKDLSHAINRYNLTGEVLLPTLAKDLEDLASLHYVPSPSSSSPPSSTAPAVPPPANDIVHDRRLTFPVSVQEQRLAVPPESIQEQRVVAVPPESVPEQRVVPCKNNGWCYLLLPSATQYTPPPLRHYLTQMYFPAAHVPSASRSFSSSRH